MRLLRTLVLLLVALVLVRPLSSAPDTEPTRPTPADDKADKPSQPFFNTDAAIPRFDSPSTWAGFQSQGMPAFASFTPFSSTPTGSASPGRYGNSYSGPYSNDYQTQMANYLANQQAWQTYQMYQQWQNSHSRMGGGQRPLPPGIGATVGGDAGASGSCLNAHNNAILGLTPGNPFSSCFVAGTLVSTGPGSFEAIEAIRVGQRIAPDAGKGAESIEPARWRQVEMQAIKSDGTTAAIVLLRSAEWVESHQAKVGGTISINLPGCGFTGNATVTAIRPCPSIESGAGSVVTGTIRQSSAGVINLRIDGLAEPIGTTGNHWFCSEDHNGFVRAGELAKGEQLRGRSENPRVVSGEPRKGSEAVYNLEVTGGKFHVSRLELLVRDAATSR